MPKERSEEQTAVSISLSKDALAKIDGRARQLGLSRSAYLKLLASQDLAQAPVPGLSAAAPAAPVAAEPRAQPALAAASAPAPLNLTAEIYDFLLIAIPAMQEYLAAKERGGSEPPGPPTVEPSDALGESNLWKFFLLEREEIERHKYLRSQQLGYDMGLNAAVKEWLHIHHWLWAAAHPPEV